MSKLDEIRRQREARERTRENAEPAPKLAPVIPLRAGTAKASAEPTVAGVSPENGREAGAESGKCPECGKLRPLERGLLPNHQKGLGKRCPGSRRAPA